MIPPVPYYLTRDQVAAIAALDDDVAVRGYEGEAEGQAVEVLVFLPSEVTWDHESILLDPSGAEISRTRIEDAP